MIPIPPPLFPQFPPIDPSLLPAPLLADDLLNGASTAQLLATRRAIERVFRPRIRLLNGRIAATVGGSTNPSIPQIVSLLRPICADNKFLLSAYTDTEKKEFQGSFRAIPKPIAQAVAFQAMGVSLFDAAALKASSTPLGPRHPLRKFGLKTKSDLNRLMIVATDEDVQGKVDKYLGEELPKLDVVPHDEALRGMDDRRRASLEETIEKNPQLVIRMQPPGFMTKLFLSIRPRCNATESHLREGYDLKGSKLAQATRAVVRMAKQRYCRVNKEGYMILGEEGTSGRKLRQCKLPPGREKKKKKKPKKTASSEDDDGESVTGSKRGRTQTDEDASPEEPPSQRRRGNDGGDVPLPTDEGD